MDIICTGDLITLSRNKVTGDRSYCNDIWKVIGVNETHLRITSIIGESCETSFGEDRIILKKEFDISKANGLLIDNKNNKQNENIYNKELYKNYQI